MVDTSSNNPGKLTALTSLRFVAAFMVVVAHSCGHFGIPRYFGYPIIFGQAVAFFFVLSGFILTFVYPSLATADVPRFLLARIARIWPAHLFCLLLSCIFMPPFSAFSKLNILLRVTGANMFLVHSWIPWPEFYGAFNAPTWSISTEWFFYLCFPFLIYRLERNWPFKLALAAGLVIAVICYCHIAHVPNEGANLKGATLEGLMYKFPPVRLLEFVFGMILAIHWQRFRSRVTFGRVPGTLVELTVICAVLFAMYHSVSWTSVTNRFSWLGKPAGTWMVCEGICTPFYGLLIGTVALGRGWISRLLEWPVLVLLGEISYSVYLLHWILIQYTGEIAEKFNGIPNWLIYCDFWVILLLGSHLLWKMIEKPARRWINGHNSRVTVCSQEAWHGGGFNMRTGVAIIEIFSLVALLYSTFMF